LLNRSDDQNARVYTENVPEHVNAINEAIARQLAPLAQAFAGVLVDQEADAIRGKDRASRVRADSGNGTGSCGHFGFCGALAPIACYTCKHFQLRRAVEAKAGAVLLHEGEQLLLNELRGFVERVDGEAP
jgi:hypothetical protein